MSPGFDSSSFRFESWHELHSPSASPAPVSPPAHLHPYPQILVCNKTLGDVAQLIEQSALNRFVAGLIPVIPFWKMPPTGRQLVLKTRVRQRCRRCMREGAGYANDSSIFLSSARGQKARHRADNAGTEGAVPSWRTGYNKNMGRSPNWNGTGEKLKTGSHKDNRV